MKAEVVAKFAVWFVIFIILITLGFEMISAPNTIEKMWIEKWDGKLPVYGQVPTIFKDISK